MTRDEARAMAALMLDYANGKTIQLNYEGEDWYDLDAPDFNRPFHKYRIKPEPKEVWVNEYEHGDRTAWDCRDAAIQASASHATRVAVHYREVCDE